VLRKGFLTAILAAMFLLLSSCSNISNEPVRWSSAAEVPVTNEKFVLIDEFDNLFDSKDTIKFVDPDTSKKGDTIKFVKPSIDSFEFESKEDKIDTQTIFAVLGPVPLTTAATIGDTVSLAAPAGSFSGSVSISVRNVYKVTFYDTATSILPVNVDNVSASALSNVSIALPGVDTQVIASIPAYSSGTANMDVRNKSLSHNITVAFTGIAASGGAKQLGLTFSLNGQLVSSCSVSDSLVKFKKTVNTSYDITDTVAMDYIDFENGTFNYTVKNQTGLELKVGVNHEHLWQRGYCAEKLIESVSDLKKNNSLDSVSYYAGNKILMGVKNILPNSNDLIAQSNIADRRLFTLWDTTRLKTYTSIEYSIETADPTGDTVTLNADDSIRFTVSAVTFKFREFLGTVKLPYVRNVDTQKVAITLPDPLDQSMMDSLRGHVVFGDVKGVVNARASMPERSYIDTMELSFVAQPQNAMLIRDSTLTRFTNVINDSLYIRSINITNVTNQFPDTVIINTKIKIPAGTRMRVCNDLASSDELDYKKYIGRMTVKLATRYILEPKIDWTVTAPALLDLGSSHFEVIEPLRFFRKLEDRKVLMSLKIKNNSNLNMHIYSLIAPDNLMDTLDSLSTDEFVSLIMKKDSAEKRGFVNFMSDTGIYVPKRQDTAFALSEVRLDHSQLETILSADSCSWRWLARLEVQNRDALTDTDYIDIRSKLRIDGINSTDSLLIWE